MSDAFAGQLNPEAWGSHFNLMDFVGRQLLSGTATAAMVLVKAVTSTGDVAAPGTVDVQPMVAMIDASGKAYPHGTVFELPFFRLQGGANAFIIDPQVGDIGVAVFCSHDISAVKASKAPAPPGSRRRFDMADGLYLGGFLNGVPTRYVRFASDGLYVVSPDKVTVQAPEIDLNASTKVVITTPEADVTASSVVNVSAPTVNLGGAGGAAVARVGDTVAGGVITTGSSHVKAT